jgi:hypothetical protein
MVTHQHYVMNEFRVKPQLFIALDVLEDCPWGHNFHEVIQVIIWHHIFLADHMQEFVTVIATKSHIMFVDEVNEIFLQDGKAGG